MKILEGTYNFTRAIHRYETQSISSFSMNSCTLANHIAELKPEISNPRLDKVYGWMIKYFGLRLKWIKLSDCSDSREFYQTTST